MTDMHFCRKDAFYGTHQNKKAELSKGEPCDATVNFNMHRTLQGLIRLIDLVEWE